MKKQIEKRAQRIVDHLPVLMRFFHRFSHSVLIEAEMTLPQFQTFSAFSWQDNWNLSDLAEFLQIKNPAASELVDRLVKSGLLQRETNPNDRRQTILTLTDQGKTFLSERKQRLLEGYQRLLNEMSVEDQKRVEFAFSELYQISLAFMEKENT